MFLSHSDFDWSLRVWRRPRYRYCCRYSFLFLFTVFILVYVLQISSNNPTLSVQSTPQSSSGTGIGSVPPGGANLIRLPFVDRSILKKLELVDRFLAGPEDQYLEEANKQHIFPPAVTRLPEGSHIPTNIHRDPTLDVEFCGTSPCRLLLPSYIGEQESKARRHLLQLASLAIALNRTLVLPNVGKSRMSTCSKWDFDFYYEIPDLAGAVTFGAFRRWVALHARKPRAQVVEILPTFSSSKRDDIHITSTCSSEIPESANAVVVIAPSSNPAKTTHNHCLQARTRNLHFGDYSPLLIHPRSGLPDAWDRNVEESSRFGREVVCILSSWDVTKESMRAIGRRLEPQVADMPDVLVVNWELRRPIFRISSPFALLRYAERWTKVAEALSERLQPFVAIHWRMERVPKSSISTCVPLLISSISSLLSQHDTAASGRQSTSVYLATDYPTEGPDRPHSGTFEVGEEHHEAIRLFKSAFQAGEKLAQMRLTTLAEELKMGVLVQDDFSLEDLDMGLMGIIDKMVLIQANLFISGGPLCGKVSSFTGQIIDDRGRDRSSSGSTLGNVVQYFGGDSP